MRRVALSAFVFIFTLTGGCEKKTTVETRRKPNFPPEAEHVVIFGQSSHLDISWVYTSDEYYEKLVMEIFKKTIEFLKEDEEHIAFFAEMFWIDRFLKEVEGGEFLSFMREGRIRIEGGGIGTDEQLVVPTEGIIRNYIRGHSRLKKLGIEVPQNAWIPDSFGFARTTPDLYSIMGFKAIALSRVNGFSAPSFLYYVKPLAEGNYEFPPGSIHPGSGGHELSEKGQLVIWEGRYKPNRIILHWMPFLYGVGSSLFCKSGLAPPVYIKPDLECISEEDIATQEDFARKLQVYLSKIKPNSRFVFIPIGWDFERPKMRLGEHIRFWNERYYPKNKIYLLSGSFSDYIELVEAERENLPRFSGHLAPYWTGYFGSYANIKKFIFEVIYRLLTVETSVSIGKYLGIKFDEGDVIGKLNDLWDAMGMMTNHDTGAGTLYKRTYQKEIKELMESIKKKLSDLERQVYNEFSRRVEAGKYVAINPLSFEREGIPPFGTKVIHHIPEPQVRECIRPHWNDKVLFSDDVPIETKIVLWEDEGGSWRIGSETPPGRFQERSHTISPTQRQCHLIDGEIRIVLRFEEIPLGHSLTIRFMFGTQITAVLVEQHLEIAEFERRYQIYDPTFLPYLNFFKVYTRDNKAYTFSTKGAKGVAKTSEDSVDVFIGRNVRFEKYDTLGPTGDMSEDGPFEIEVQITQDENDLTSLISAYSHQFPLLFVRGSGNRTELPHEFSAMRISGNIGILLSTIEKPIVRTVLPSEKIEFSSNIFESAQPISPLFGTKAKFSNTFEMIPKF